MCGMTCMEAEKMVIPYIEDRLSLAELEEFMEHIRTCENCREELEIYYMVDVGLKKLDEDNGTYDIAGDLRRKLAESERILRRLLMFRITGYAVNTLMFMGVLVTLLLQIRIWWQAGFLF